MLTENFGEKSLMENNNTTDLLKIYSFDNQRYDDGVEGGKWWKC